MLSLFELSAVFLTATAISAWLVRRFLPWPANIGMLAMGLAVSVLMIGVKFLFPGSQIYSMLADAINQIDFYEALMHGMLAFLLFAGALHVDIGRLRNRAASVGILATIGVLISAFVVGTGFWLAAAAMSLPLSYAWALVFGAILAPTDPVAVLSTLKTARISPALEIELTGEALFNDGVGVVLFAILLQVAVSGGGETVAYDAIRLFLIEGGVGALLGLLTGYVVYRAMRAIDDYPAEVMLSLALVTGTYALAERLHVSGPIAVVVAGVLIGNRGASRGMSDVTKRYLFAFWTLVDEILNAALFLLIGLEVLVLNFDADYAWIALLSVPLMLVARSIAVAVPVFALTRWQAFAPGTIPVLIWGGIRGGISIALALSLPSEPARTLILHAIYPVVIFSVIVQGLSLGWLVGRVASGQDQNQDREQKEAS